MVRYLMRPSDAATAKEAVELLRGWIIDGQPQYVLLPTVWNDDLPSWGRFLADTARHLSNAISEDTNRDANEILRIITSSFMHEINQPTNVHEGNFHK